MEAASELSARLLDHHGEAESLKELSVPVPSLPFGSELRGQRTKHRPDITQTGLTPPSLTPPSLDLSRPGPLLVVCCWSSGWMTCVISLRSAPPGLLGV